MGVVEYGEPIDLDAELKAVFKEFGFEVEGLVFRVWGFRFLLISGWRFGGLGFRALGFGV